MPMTGKERAALRAEAHHLTPLVHVGHQGLTPTVFQALDDALRAVERTSRKQIATALTGAVGATLTVQAMFTALLALAAYLALGGTVGVGTVLYAIAIGPLLHILLPRFRIAPPALPVACRSND